MKTGPLRHGLSALALALAVSGLAAAAGADTPAALYVFGDSVSDSGNVALAIGQPSGVPQVITGNSYIPDLPYYPSGRFSNGPVWAEDFAARLGLAAAPSLIGGTDFAFAGARTGGPDVPAPTLTTQVGMFLQSVQGQAPGNALYVVAEVGNDARDALAAIAAGADAQQTIAATAATYAGNVGALVDSLRAAGASRFLVFENVNLGLVPSVQAAGTPGLATLLTNTMNRALVERLRGQAGVTLFDTFQFLTGVVRHPAAFGFANATDACGAVASADCRTYVFWDGIHPTAALHAVIADAALRCTGRVSATHARTPSWCVHPQ